MLLSRISGFCSQTDCLGKTRFIRFGRTLSLSLGTPQSRSADQVNNTVSVPLSFNVNRYFKPLWKPSHLLDTNLKSCGNCLRPTAQIFLRAKPTRAFMNNQEPDINPTPAEADSAKTNESVQRDRSELPVDQQSSYLRSRQIALKKFSPQAQGGDPS